MKREQIKELKGMISQAVADDRITQSCAVEIMDKIDAILALPLEVPSDDEIEKLYPTDMGEIKKKEKLGALSYGAEIVLMRIANFNSIKQASAKWMRDEIIKRNK